MGGQIEPRQYCWSSKAGSSREMVGSTHLPQKRAGSRRVSIMRSACRAEGTPAMRGRKFDAANRVDGPEGSSSR